MILAMSVGLCAAFLWANTGRAAASQSTIRDGTIPQASSSQDFGPAGALDGDRFSAGPGQCWKGKAGDGEWWWQAAFPEAVPVGAILQINGDAPNTLSNAPAAYVWQWSADGSAWHDISATRQANDRRMFRIHRLPHAQMARFLRIHITRAEGPYPALREVEIYAEPRAKIPFDHWLIGVCTYDKPDLPDSMMGFFDLARRCPGWEGVQGQAIWLEDFNEAFLAAEPRPLCAFLSGNFREWCEIAREPWRGTQEVLQNRNLPIWASCGGAQGWAILDTVGVDAEWDCPRCRDPKNPGSPVYTHIGYVNNGENDPCGVYTNNIFERGVFNVLQTAEDPVFRGVPREFPVMESHCGQIEWAPEGWTLVATHGTGGKTKTQCMRVMDRYIYAAQFHMELFSDTLDVSRTLMGNFLALAREWGGYNPDGEDLPPPEPFPPDR